MPSPPHNSKTNYGGTHLPEKRALLRRSPRDATLMEYKISNGLDSRKKKDEWKRHVLIGKLEDRDGYIGCRVCGTTENLTIDHIIPKALKGQNIFSNKQVLCLYHNNLKGDLPPGKNGWWPDKLIGYIDSYIPFNNSQIKSI